MGRVVEEVGASWCSEVTRTAPLSGRRTRRRSPGCQVGGRKQMGFLGGSITPLGRFPRHHHLGPPSTLLPAHLEPPPAGPRSTPPPPQNVLGPVVSFSVTILKCFGGKSFFSLSGEVLMLLF